MMEVLKNDDLILRPSKRVGGNNKKGNKTTSDYIPFETALERGKKMMNNPKTRTLGLYIIFSINTGLRISDILKLKYKDITTGVINLIETKTKKARVIKLNNHVLTAFELLKEDQENAPAPDDYIFVSQKKTPYIKQSIIKLLKEVAFKKEAKELNISSHSLRKSFGRHVYETQPNRDKALVYLSELLNHSSPATTRRYLGIRQEELNDIYENL